MKSRSHRPTAEPHHDDWVDGSWTVDCICGVNYDDGEEMVDCDECGVWVHTRCSRYVKSEKSFSCDKCKSKNSGGGGGGGSVGNDSEETEVAEFLVELPTKTLRMDNPIPTAVSSHRPFRLWANIPMEEKVHVQGVPGGEPALFSGVEMSSVIGPQLWKCAGYVPKKFNFRYSEFPCLGDVKVEEEEGRRDKTSGEDIGNRDDNGAGVLISLLQKKDNVLPAPVMDSSCLRGPVESKPSLEVVTPREKKKKMVGVEDPDSRTPEKSIKKERSSLPVLLLSGKRRKEGFMLSKDQRLKKKARSIEREGYVKKRAVHSSKAGDGKRLEFSQHKGSKATGEKHSLGDRLLDGLGECATNLASNEHGLEATLKNDVSIDEISKRGSRGDDVLVGSDNVSKTSSLLGLLPEVTDSQKTPIKEEIGAHEKKPVVVEVRTAVEDAKESEHSLNSDDDQADSRPNKKLKGGMYADDHTDHYGETLKNDVKINSPKATTQHHESTVNITSEGKVVGISTMGSETSEPKVLDESRTLTAGGSRTDKSEELGGSACQTKREPHGSEGSLVSRKRTSGLKHSSEVADELLKSDVTARSNSTASYQRKAVISTLKSSSTPGSIKSKSSENCMAATGQNLPIHSRQKELSDGSSLTMKDNSSADKVEHEEKSIRQKKLVKEPARSSSLPKVSEPTRLSNASNSKRPSTDLKDPTVHSSSKAILVPNVTSGRILSECASPPTTEGASHLENKTANSTVPVRGEKFQQSSSHPSSRGHVTSMTAQTSSNVPATLSDEELALLLHQELNSSPRVPRVPRMRHAGSLPQLSGPTATSTLMKRSSSGGGKDQSVASRRRVKDSSGEGSHTSHEVDNEAKKMETKPHSTDSRRQDTGYNVELVSRKDADGGLVKNVQLMKKAYVGSSFSSSGEANGHNISSSHPSSRNASDDDPRLRQTNHTLPSLIAEIMSEGKRMTYEELCNVVLPHWPHLRKHNGERYAYSSHSQAVLDCLRNRSEWARLVDRGPKTNASRKRRKLDADSIIMESEENEDEKVKNAKDVGTKSFDSHQEDFPKGKRKARKRRRLALQGRGIVRRRRRADVISDDESESFSNSSENSVSSEEEIQGGGASFVGSEASSSSEDEIR